MKFYLSFLLLLLITASCFFLGLGCFLVLFFVFFFLDILVSSIFILFFLNLLLLIIVLLIPILFNLIAFFVNLILLHLYAVIVPLTLTVHTSSVSPHITHISLTLHTSVHLCYLFLIFLMAFEILV